MTIIIAILAFFIRSYNLLLFPLNSDEANEFLVSVNNFDKFIGIPVSCFDGYMYPFIGYLIFFSKSIFSSPEYIVRVPSVVIGGATVILIYKLAKEMYGKNAGLISSVLLCFLPWHVIQSRNGLEIILVPFFGCLIALSLVKSLQKRNNAWFILFWFFLSLGSFYIYNGAIIFAPIFITAIVYLRNDFSWVRPKVLLGGLCIFFMLLYPLLYLDYIGEINFFDNILRNSTKNPFDGNLLANLFNNFRNNNAIAFKSLFFSSNGKGRILYGAALGYPLLIHWIMLPIIFTSLMISAWKRKPADKVILIWLAVGYLVPTFCIDFFKPRYIIIALPVFLILIGKLTSQIFFDHGLKKKFIKFTLLFTGIIFYTGLVFAEIYQVGYFYSVAPKHLEQCRRNGYGCKEAAYYLSQLPDIENYEVIDDYRMAVLTYFNYFRKSKVHYNKNKRKGRYYVIWAPESHPESYWSGRFSRRYNSFKHNNPDKMPIKIIYYPNGLEAIYIFKVGSKV